MEDFDPELLRMYMMGAARPPGNKKRFDAADLVDLHVDKKTLESKHYNERDSIFLQLEEFEKSLDKAIAAGKFELRIIHGLGSGKLKEAIHKILAKHPHVKSFNNDYHSKYGHGSTVIYFN